MVNRWRVAIVLLGLLPGSLAALERVSDGPFAGTLRLPAGGYAPDHLGYPADRIEERLLLVAAADGEDTVMRCLTFAGEKLGEAVRMVRAEEAGFAWVAVGLYRDYLERGSEALGAVDVARVAAVRQMMAKAVLEHVWLLSEIYPSLPLEVRAFALQSAVNTALLHFDALRQALTREQRTALKERVAAVRGAVDMMQRADLERRLVQPVAARVD